MRTAAAWLAGERAVWTAWLLLVAGNLLLGVVIPNDRHSLLEQGVLSWAFLSTLAGVAVAHGYLVALVRWVRHGAGGGGSQPQHGGVRPLGTWGYVWRAYLVLMLTLFPLVAWSLGFAVARAPVPRVPQWGVAALFVVAPPPIAWLLFGRDRRNAVRRLFGGGGATRA